jgi:DNA-binding NtrC family response regulator
MGGPARILVVDDEAAILALLRGTLAASGFDVCEAGSASEALEVARQQPPFDVVITDVQMPDVDGFELARRLSRNGHAARFIFVSGYCDSPSVEERMEGLNGAFLEKPFAIQELIRVLRELLEQGEASSRWRSQAG